MNVGYDIFIKTSGRPMWLGSVGDLSRATDLMNRMAARAPGEYCIFHGGTVVVAISKDGATSSAHKGDGA